MRCRLTTSTLALGLTTLLAACGGSSTQPSQTPGPGGGNADATTINIPSSDGYGTSSFSPAAVTVPVGRQVIWRNADSFVHTTTANSGAWNLQINGNGEASHTFNTRGTFDYRCTLHPTMTGSITVQ